MAAQGVTLEEYIAQLAGFTPQNPLRAMDAKSTYTVFRVPLDESGASFDIPERAVWQASADNCGGLIVTAGSEP